MATDIDKKKQAAELVKNADKQLKAGDPITAMESVEMAWQLDPANLYAQAFRERIKSVIAKGGFESKQILLTPQPKQEQPQPPPIVPPSVPAPIPQPEKKVEAPVVEAPVTAKLRKLAAIMFTDMVEYTALSQTNEALALQLIDTHQKLIRPLFSKFDGKEIKTIGDAFLAEFVSVLQAVRCALEIQKVLHQHNTKAPKEKKIQLRIGVHLGDVIYKDNDIFGDGVNIASRIQTLANPGGISVSQDVYNQIRSREEFIIEYVGEVELKNILSPLPIYKVLTEVEIAQKRENEATTFAIQEGKQEAQAKKIQEFLTRAKEQTAKNNLLEALIEVTKILQINQQHPEARLIDSQIRAKRIETIQQELDAAKKPTKEQRLEIYKEALRYARQEETLTQEEMKILSSWRAELQLAEQDHEEAMRQK